MNLLLRSAAVAYVCIGSLSAAPACVSAALSTFLVAGFECEIDSAIFSEFTFSSVAWVTTPLTADEITVSPLEVGGRIGLRFAGEFESEGLPNGPGPAEGLSSVQYRFMFEVTRPGSLFVDALVALNDPFRFSPNALKFGGVLSAKSISNDGATAITNDQDPDLTDIGTLFTPRTTITIDELLQLTGGASAAGTVAPVGFVSLASADNLFGFEVIVPEPGTWLAGIGSVLLLFHQARSRRGSKRPDRNRGVVSANDTGPA